jgi:hypothetical protein
MASLIQYPLAVVAYFAAAWAMLRLLSHGDTKQLLARSAILAVACTLPLLIGGLFMMVALVLVAVAAMRVLILYDTPFVASLAAVVLGSVAAFFVVLALK